MKDTTKIPAFEILCCRELVIDKRNKLFLILHNVGQIDCRIDTLLLADDMIAVT